MGWAGPYNCSMADFLVLLVTVSFFTLTAGFILLCDRIIGPDSDHGDPQGAGEADLPVASTVAAGR